MSSFEKKTWVARSVEYPGRRTLKKTDGTEETVDVERAEGTITTEGDAFSVTNMNGLERRIDEAISTVEQTLAGKQATLTFDTTPTAGSGNPVTSGGLYDVLGNIGTALDKINGESV